MTKKNGKPHRPRKPADGQRPSTHMSDADHLPKIGRPPRLSNEIKETICQALRLGLTMEAGASLAGVSISTVYGWLRRGKAAKAGGFTGFVKAVEQALTQFEARNAAVVNRAAQDGDYRAALALLERRRPKTWARTERHEISGQEGQPIRYEIVREESTDWRAAIVTEDAKPTNGNGRT